MSWFDLYPSLTTLYSSWPPPAVIILHLSGNDLGSYKTLDLNAQIKVDLLHLHVVLPSTILIFSEIVPRIKWLLNPELVYLEKIRKRVNRTIAKFMALIDGLYFHHIDLGGGLPGFYRLDQVHLSDIANDSLNLDFQSGIELAVAQVGCHARLS